LAWAFVLTASFFTVELVTGVVSGSLALVSDAGHMAADVVALGATLIATRLATRPDRSGRRTFGSYRAEVFASGLVVLIMFGVSAYVIIEAINRIGEDPEVDSVPMLVVGFLGLLINVISMFLLRSGSRESLNVKAAYFEVIADAAGSVGVMIAGALIIITGSPVWDLVVALAIAAFVIVRACVVGREVLSVLGQNAPVGMDPAVVNAELAAITGVEQVHDLHLWTLTSGMNVATAHLVADAEADQAAVLMSARAALREKFAITHATVQIEDSNEGRCQDVTW
jgi:cobalt-zinc-cadmium efflux system protein